MLNIEKLTYVILISQVILKLMNNTFLIVVSLLPVQKIDVLKRTVFIGFKKLFFTNSLQLLKPFINKKYGLIKNRLKNINSVNFLTKK